ncbi:hypothetical protein C5167_026732 [Papaver somniferum]|nr:hypothetical protein C5167_026732 [Papaver somniferum]
MGLVTLWSLTNGRPPGILLMLKEHEACHVNLYYTLLFK